MLQTLQRWLGLSVTEVAPLTVRSPKWPAVRAKHLKTHPRCAACGTKESLNVHHLLPVSWPGGKARELDPDNLLTLCESSGRNCHLWVGHCGDWKSRNAQAREDADVWLGKIRNRPYPTTGRDARDF